MKSQTLILAVAIFAVNVPTCFAQADGNEEHTREEVAVKALLTPYTGFEEKNNIQVVLYGALPNGCYSLAEYTTERLDEHTIGVHQYALRDHTGVCADETTMPNHMRIPVPFMQEVSIGRLSVGDYRFVYTKEDFGSSMRTMNVAKNVNPMIDSLPYAAVSAVHASDVVMSLEHLKVKVSGVLNSTCTSLDPKVKVLRQGDVLVLLPTVSVRHETLCAQVLIPFEKEIDLGKVEPGIHLIHTRSMNGKAVNKVVNVTR